MAKLKTTRSTSEAMRDLARRFTSHYPVIANAEVRARKGIKIARVLQAVLNGRRPEIILDIGCSNCLVLDVVRRELGSSYAIGVDMDVGAIATPTMERATIVGDAQRLPLPDTSVDLVICNHVYEHVPDPEQLFAEINRVLKNDGVCYFGAASRLTVMEPHYRLPFLSWLPKPLAGLYMRLTRKGNHYYENLRTLAGIQRLISEFSVLDCTLEIIENPDKFHARDLLPQGGFLERIPLTIWRCLYWVLPSYIFILKRRSK